MKKVSGDPIVINELEDEDTEKAQHLLVESYKQYEAYFAPEDWTKYINGIMKSVVTPNADTILVAKAGEDILGSVQLFQSSAEAYNRPDLQIFAPIVRLLAVHPKARGRGVAKKLLKAVIKQAKMEGASNIYLHSPDFMETAVQLYKNFGFKQDQSKEFVDGGGTIRCYRFDIQEHKA